MRSRGATQHLDRLRKRESPVLQKDNCRNQAIALTTRSMSEKAMLRQREGGSGATSGSFWPFLVWHGRERLVRTEVLRAYMGKNKVLRWNWSAREPPQHG